MSALLLYRPRVLKIQISFLQVHRCKGILNTVKRWKVKKKKMKAATWTVKTGVRLCVAVLNYSEGLLHNLQKAVKLSHIMKLLLSPLQKARPRWLLSHDEHLPIQGHAFRPKKHWGHLSKADGEGPGWVEELLCVHRWCQSIQPHTSNISRTWMLSWKDRMRPIWCSIKKKKSVTSFSTS